MDRGIRDGEGGRRRRKRRRAPELKNEVSFTPFSLSASGEAVADKAATDRPSVRPSARLTKGGVGGGIM